MLKLKHINRNPVQIKYQPKSHRPKWQDSKKSDFTINLDNRKIDELSSYLEQLQINTANVTKSIMNDICWNISVIFENSADKSFTVNQSFRTNEDDKSHKRWFGARCQSARRKYHLARKINRLNPSPTNKSNLKEASQQYKQTMNLHINKFNQNTQEKLRNLKTSSPKDFWKLINNLECHKNDQNINLESLYNFFKDLNTFDDQSDDTNFSNIDISDDDELLNSTITEAEIRNCIKNLKNNKCPARDRIINEYLKCSADKMMSIYLCFFNLVLDTGIIPDPWLEGIIRPIYKHAGDPKQPENYRPITVLSCFGKLFTAILNTRLNNFVTYHNILEENQAGFRSGYSTVDHIFTLHVLSEILKHNKKKLFCAFIDFSKAFDSVWRVGLWMKLLSNNINGKLFRIVYNMYKNIKSCVIHSGEQSCFFYSQCGVRQGENLSPILFSLFLNDLEDYMSAYGCNGIEVNMGGDQIELFLKLMVLLYADDTVILGTDAENFQNNLNIFYDYTKQWNLNINYNKTKIMIFGARNTRNFQFKLGNSNIEICDDFKYLGVQFSKYRSFHKTIKHNVEHAKKALHLLYKRINNLHIPIDLQIHLFDHTILPILLYGCEVWGFSNLNMIEIVHNQFLRNITTLRKSTPVYMLHAELGRVPIELHVKSRMIGYWISLVNGKTYKYSRQIYNIMFVESLRGKSFRWLDYIKSIMISVGMPDLIHQPVINNPKSIKARIIRTLKDLHTQDWHAKLEQSSKGQTYGIFKQDLNFEPYLRSLSQTVYIPLIEFRTSNYKLPVETGRWENIPLQERKCNLCNKNDLGDGFHYLLVCTHFTNVRTELLKPYYYTRPNILKYKDLLTCTNKNILLNLSKFVKTIMKEFP